MNPSEKKDKSPAFFLLLLISVFGFILHQDIRFGIAWAGWEFFDKPISINLLEKSTHSQLAYEIGNTFFTDARAGNYDLDQASIYYQHAISLNPLFSEPWLMLGRIDFIRGDFSSALFKINRLDPGIDDFLLEDFTGFYYWRGLVLSYLERFDESETDFIKVIEGNKKQSGVGSWAAYVDLAWVYFQRGKYQAISDLMEEAVVIYPDNPWVLTMYGVALYNLGLEEDAEPHLKKAIVEAEKLTPEDWENSYPGNNPLHAEAGLKELIGAIRFNSQLVDG